jgi:hypothetical protein
VSLTVLSVGYPLAPLSADPVGGAEQVLARLDRALVAGGHRSVVIAPEGSEVAGELVPVPAVAGSIGEADAIRVRAAVRDRIAEVVAREVPDVIHLHGIDFDAYLPPPGPPVLVTLHLPLDWYAPGALGLDRPNTHLHPVSAAQAATAPPGLRLGAPIENGVEVPPRGARKRRYAFALGRICPEKGFDDALDAARAARVPFLMAGTVFPYPFHEAHFREAILPRLDRRRRFVAPSRARPSSASWPRPPACCCPPRRAKPPRSSPWRRWPPAPRSSPTRAEPSRRSWSTAGPGSS